MTKRLERRAMKAAQRETIRHRQNDMMIDWLSQWLLGMKNKGTINRIHLGQVYNENFIDVLAQTCEIQFKDLRSYEFYMNIIAPQAIIEAINTEILIKNEVNWDLV